MIQSYSPDDIKLDLNIISNKYTYGTTVIEAKSVVIQKNIQQIDLPYILYDDDDDYDLVISLRLSKILYLIFRKSIFENNWTNICQ